ncbi:ATP-binding protein [Bacillus fonticola]|uniref:ATP-binding protein n=1 Tax=Bacillus fonticola TaxID=2728853 RepID=UPI001472E7C2|nr:ATP-binding protein [Bacillus fonticola]
MIWRSVVGKLWLTILLLVSFVLFVLTILLLEFFQSYHVAEVEKDLTSTASKIAFILAQEDDFELGLEIAWEVVDDLTKVIVYTSKEQFFLSPEDENGHLPFSVILEDPELSKAITEGEVVKKQVVPVSGREGVRFDQYVVIGVPFVDSQGERGAVYIYQSLEVMRETIQSTTKSIFLSAGIAIVLTTIFAFFLSTRITAPLRKMKEAVSEISKGKFDTKVPKLTRDEIGDLATAFNKMGKQLHYNISALRQEKEHLSSLLSSMADGVITFNRDGSILLTNPPSERFLKYWYYEKTDEELDLPPKLQELFQSAVLTEREQVGELSLQGRAWTIIVSPLYNQRSIRGAVAVIRDMTEDRRLDKLRKDFIANVSHELRTPIAMLQGYSEAIVDGIAQSEEEQKEMAQIIYDESLRMGRLVNDLLDLARMEAGHITLVTDDIELYPFMEKIMKKFSGPSREKSIQLTWNLEGTETSAHFDPDKVEQVFTNLIDNALRHTPKNGRVHVTSKAIEQSFAVEVTDTGSGIREEDLPFVFERFYKGDKARKRGTGTGLGLSIARNIVEAHNGHISVHSKWGQGTTFLFTLPRKKRDRD